MRHLGIVSLGALAFAATLSSLTGLPASAAAARAVPAPALDEGGSGLQTAVLAGGCFWGVEAVFEHLKGVKNVVSGYAGGAPADANYGRVGGGRTGHAEVVRITYDPRQISYGQLLRIFVSVAHDPTQLNRQGPDSGPQYRSAIFPQTAGQAKVARAYLGQLGKARIWPGKIVTRIESGRFFPAETFHQDFMRKNPNHPYIRAHDAPKVAALKAGYPGLYR